MYSRVLTLKIKVKNIEASVISKMSTENTKVYRIRFEVGIRKF